MPVITKAALEWLQEELENVTAQRDELEDELAEAMEENASLKARIQLMTADREVVA